MHLSEHKWIALYHAQKEATLCSTFFLWWQLRTLRLFTASISGIELRYVIPVQLQSFYLLQRCALWMKRGKPTWERNEGRGWSKTGEREQVSEGHGENKRGMKHHSYAAFVHISGWPSSPTPASPTPLPISGCAIPYIHVCQRAFRHPCAQVLTSRNINNSQKVTHLPTHTHAVSCTSGHTSSREQGGPVNSLCSLGHTETSILGRPSLCVCVGVAVTTSYSSFIHDRHALHFNNFSSWRLVSDNSAKKIFSICLSKIISQNLYCNLFPQFFNCEQTIARLKMAFNPVPVPLWQKLLIHFAPL